MEHVKILAPLPTAFDNLPDPRNASGKRYKLKSMLTMAIAAMLNGATGPTSISEWGRSRSKDELEKLGFDKGKSPCGATFFLLFEKLDSVELEKCLRIYFEGFVDHETAIAIDGKVLRGSRQDEMPAVQLLATFGHKTKVVFNQKWISSKTNEITAIIPLLEELDVEGKVLTADALHTQKKIANGQ